MPHSRPNLKPRMFAEIQRRFSNFATPIIDVGAGDGNIGRRLTELGYCNITALEIWEPYVEQFKLRSVYKDVIVKGFADESFEGFKLAIFGDVLEHVLPAVVRDALQRCAKAGCSVLAIVPWKTPQGPWGGNPYEVHVQADLTPKVMLKRYPELKMLARDNAKGLYARLVRS